MELNVGSGKKCSSCGGTVAAGRKTCQNCGHSFATLPERVQALEAAVLALGSQELGDSPGHPFHGNQWTEGGGGSEKESGGGRGGTASIVSNFPGEPGRTWRADVRATPGHVGFDIEGAPHGRIGSIRESVKAQMGDAFPNNHQVQVQFNDIDHTMRQGDGEIAQLIAQGLARVK